MYSTESRPQRRHATVQQPLALSTLYSRGSITSRSSSAKLYTSITHPHVSAFGAGRITEPIGAHPHAISSVPQSDSPQSRTLAHMVLGLGTDMIEIARIEHSLSRFGDAFLHRIYTPAEIAYCRHKKRTAAESFAARFAAKEAA